MLFACESFAVGALSSAGVYAEFRACARLCRGGGEGEGMSTKRGGLADRQTSIWKDRGNS